jgi:hypothetical protein
MADVADIVFRLCFLAVIADTLIVLWRKWKGAEVSPNHFYVRAWLVVVGVIAFFPGIRKV